MQQEFIDAYDELFDSGIKRLRKGWVMKLETIAACRKQLEDDNIKKLEREAKKKSESIVSLSLSSDEEEDFESEDIWKNYFKIKRRKLANIDLSSSDSESDP
tara:strand:- start:221 stop:526 length:306 start_codon:yes stop_codon:yes gene_type:complete